MTIEIPDDQVPEELTEAAIRGLIRFAATDHAGARFELLRVGDGEVDVRVDEDTPHHERVSIGD